MESLPRFEVGCRCRCDESRIPPGREVSSIDSRAEPVNGSSRQLKQGDGVRRPKGAKYKNLVARGNVIYYQRVVSGRRIRFSCRTDDWHAAAEVARLYEQKTGVGGVPFYAGDFG